METRRWVPGLLLALAVTLGACGGDPETSAEPVASPSATLVQTPPPSPSVPISPSPTVDSTPVIPAETSEDYAARAFGFSDAAGRAKSCALTEQFYRDFLLPQLASALIDAPQGCNATNAGTRFRYRVTGVSAFNPKKFYPEPIPAQTLTPLAGANRVERVVLANTTDQDFVNFWLVARQDGRFYLYHPVLFQIASCFDDRFALLADAPSWCQA